jgi:3-phosphoglycerate kinase
MFAKLDNDIHLVLTSDMIKLSLRQIDFRDHEVLVRVDFNVPLKDGVITDDTRIRAALPTIQFLIDGGAKIVLCSHLGRPEGKIDQKYSLAPVANRLSELLGSYVGFISDCISNEAKKARLELESEHVLLLENTRFYVEEEKNDANFAKKLAGSAKFFVNDAFGTAHRAHASTEGVTHFIEKNVMGFLIERELDYLVGKLNQPERPFLVIIGGAKVSDKIQVITALMEKADAFIIGGAMAYTFLKAQGYNMGKSRVESDKLELALEILAKAKARGIRFLLPADTRITQNFAEGAETKVTAVYGNGGEIPNDWEGIDIGDIAIAEFTQEIQRAKTILWNGPMGVFEINSFGIGTKAIAQAVADSNSVSIIGGGDSVTAVNKYHLDDDMSFISTGGGASLELLEGKELPGIAALTNA